MAESLWLTKYINLFFDLVQNRYLGVLGEVNNEFLLDLSNKFNKTMYQITQIVFKIRI